MFTLLLVRMSCISCIYNDLNILLKWMVEISIINIMNEVAMKLKISRELTHSL